MAGNVQNIKVCNPLKQLSGLTGNFYAICHYSYNLPLCLMKKNSSRFKRHLKSKVEYSLFNIFQNITRLTV